MLGAASITQAMAPRNGGVMKEAVTRLRMKRWPGMSVRATSQASGVATTQEKKPTHAAMAQEMKKARRIVASVNRRARLANVGEPALVVSA